MGRSNAQKGRDWLSMLAFVVVCFCLFGSRVLFDVRSMMYHLVRFLSSGLVVLGVLAAVVLILLATIEV